MSSSKDDDNNNINIGGEPRPTEKVREIRERAHDEQTTSGKGCRDATHDSRVTTGAMEVERWTGVSYRRVRTTGAEERSNCCKMTAAAAASGGPPAARNVDK